MSDREKFARLWGKLLAFVCSLGIEFATPWLFRTPEEQNALFKDGKSNADGFAKLSKHQLGIAGDLIITKNGECVNDRAAYEPLGKKWESMGGKWGGNFKAKKMKDDIYHFEV